MKKTKKMKTIPALGEVYTVRFTGAGCEQYGLRPAVVFQNNVGNRHSPNVIVLPLTTSVKKLRQPTHVLVRAAGSGLRFDSVVLCENPVTISKDKLGAYITTLSDADMRRVACGYLVATSAPFYLNAADFDALKKQCETLNAGKGASRCLTANTSVPS